MIKVEISNNSLKFLNKLEPKNKSIITEKIKSLKNSIEESGIIPFKLMDIKAMKGDWFPYKRLRIGDYRVIFLVDYENSILKIYDIDHRSNIY